MKIIEARSQFEKEEWIDFLLRSCGMDRHSSISHQVAPDGRLVPLIENNVNTCELGPRGDGKSTFIKELSPNSILISGGQYHSKPVL